MNISPPKKHPIFEEYEDLFKLTSKTADNHIAFYKNRKKISSEDLYALYTKISTQSKKFEKNQWLNWINQKTGKIWYKDLQGFESHVFEAEYLIENFLTDILEEMLVRASDSLEKAALLVEKATKAAEKAVKEEEKKPEINEEFFEKLTKEIKKSVKQEITSQLSKTRKKTKSSKKSK